MTARAGSEGGLAGEDGDQAFAGGGGGVQHRLGAEGLDQAHLGGEGGFAGSGGAEVLRADADGGGAGRDGGGEAVGGEEVHRGGADEAGDEAVGGAVEEAERGVGLLDAAGAQDDDAVGEGHRLDLVVGDVDHRRPQAGVQGGELGAHRDAELGVEVGEGLVEQEGDGVADDGAADRDALALAAGELAGAALEEGVDLEHAGGVGDAAGDLGAGQAGVLETEGEVLAHGHVRVEGVGLEDHREAAVGGADLGDVRAVDGDGAGGRAVEAGDEAEQGGLAAAGGADEDDELAVGDLERDVADDLGGAEGSGDVAEGDAGHQRRAARTCSRASRSLSV